MIITYPTVDFMEVCGGLPLQPSIDPIVCRAPRAILAVKTSSITDSAFDIFDSRANAVCGRR